MILSREHRKTVLNRNPKRKGKTYALTSAQSEGRRDEWFGPRAERTASSYRFETRRRFGVLVRTSSSPTAENSAPQGKVALVSMEKVLAGRTLAV